MRLRRIAGVTVMVTMLIGASATSASADQTTWSSLNTVTGLPHGTADPQLVPATTSLVLGYFDSQTFAWTYRRHAAAGWSPPRILARGGSPDNDRPAYTATDSVVRAAVPVTLDGEKIVFVVDDGVHRPTSTLITSHGSDPAMITDPSGNSTIAMQDLSRGGIVVFRVDSTGKVSGPVRVSPALTNVAQFSPQMAFDSAGGPVLIFGRGSASSGGRALWWSRPTGSRWTKPEQIPTDSSLLYFSMTGGGGRIVLTYTDQSDTSVRALTYAAGGWSAPATVSATAGRFNGFTVGSEVTVDASGAVAIAMSDSMTVFQSLPASPSTWTQLPSFPGTAPDYCSYASPAIGYERGQLVGAIAVTDAADNCSIVESQIGPPLAPDAPSAPTVKSASRGVRVTWAAPGRTGGDAVTTYTVIASPGGKTFTVAADRSTAVITGLAPGTYRFAIAATNAAGTSVPSPASAPIGVA